MKENKFSSYGTLSLNKIEAPKPKEKQPKSDKLYASRDSKGKGKK